MESKRLINSNIANQLGVICPEAKIAYEGVIHVINSEEYVDMWVHCAHSLLEVIDLVARANMKGKRRPRQRPADRQLSGLQNLAKKNNVKDEDCCRDLVEQCRVLYEISHHSPWTDNLVDKNYANSMLTRAENNLRILLNINKDDMKTRSK